jgi:hypothetical protein
MIINYFNDHKLLVDVKSEVRNLNLAVELLRIEISNMPSTEAPKATSSLSVSGAVSQVNEFSGRRTSNYNFDEPVTFTPLSPMPPRKPITRTRSTATL